jgi:hypothetical protein
MHATYARELQQPKKLTNCLSSLTCLNFKASGGFMSN